MQLLNQRGFSLVQVLMGTALVGFMAATGAQAMNQLMRGMKSVDSKNLTNSANQSLQVYLANENVCTASLQAMKIGAQKSMDVGFDVKGLGLFKKGEKNKGLDLETTSLSVNDLIMTETNTLGMRIYLGVLKMSFNRDQGNYVQNFREVPLGAMSLMTDSSGRVLKCVLGKLAFQEVNQNTPINPGAPVVSNPGNGNVTPGIEEYPPRTPVTPGGGGGNNGNTGGGGGYAGGGGTGTGGNGNTTTGGGGTNLGSSQCASVEQCAVYDYFLRNGFPQAMMSADEWMAETSDWKSIARSYIDSMSGLGKLNFLASANQAGLVQTGRWGFAGNQARPDTLDQWVAEAVSTDPSGRSMLTTSEGIKTLGVLFDSSGTTDNAKSILKTALTKSPELTMNSSLGIGAWVEALGYNSVNEMAKNLPAATVNAALNPGAGKDPQALRDVITYMQANPAASVDIANGTGIWAKNVQGGVQTVVDYIAGNLAASGSNSRAIAVATATTQWENALGSRQVAAEIQGNSGNAIAVATGTAIWNEAYGKEATTAHINAYTDQSASIARGTNTAVQIFGEAEVKNYISADSGKGAQGTQAIDQAKSMGYSDQEIKDYIQANPTTWHTWGQ